MAAEVLPPPPPPPPLPVLQWSAVASKEAMAEKAAPLVSRVPLLDTPASNKQGIKAAIVDANALIASSPDSLFGLSDRFFSVKEVFEEVRDPLSRARLAALPVSVEFLEPTPEVLTRVVKFARETGDLHSLSDVDLKLIAVAYMLEEQTHGTAHLRMHPPPLQTSMVRKVPEKELPGWGTNVPNLEEWEQLPNESEDANPEEDAVTDSHILGLKELTIESATEQGYGEGSSIGGAEVATSSDDRVIERDRQVKQVKDAPKTHKPRRQFTKKPEIDIEKKLNVAVGIDASKSDPQNDLEDTWEKAVSRSTRRKHERRAKRNAILGSFTNEDGESNEKVGEGNGEVTQHETEDVNGGDDVSVDNSNIIAEKVRESEDEIPAGVDEDDDDDWVSDNNRTENEACVTSLAASESNDSWMLRPLSNSTIASITSDFAMQNVLLQIGLRVLSPNGMQVHQLHRWILKCHACNGVTPDVRRLFCPKCGNGGTLNKVSVTVGPNGILYAGRRTRINIRGTRYSLPLPKGGRAGVAENPILREDQLPKKLLNPRTEKSLCEDMFAGSEAFSKVSTRKTAIRPPVREALAIFGGKRNPNDQHFRRKH